MRTEEIEYILEVYKTQSLSRAAANLNISPQGLGKAIRKAEESLGCTLFERSFHGVVPTPVCDAIIGKLSGILSSAREVETLISDFGSDNGTPEYLLAMESVLSSKLEAVLQQYNEECKKNIRIVLRPMDTEDVMERLFEKAGYDYRICTKELIRNDAYETYQIARLNFHPLVNADSPLAQKTSVCIEDFDGMTFIVDRRRPFAYRFEELCREHGVRLKMLETYDKFYLTKLLSEHNNYVYLGQRSDIDRMMRLGSFILLCLEPAFETHIVLQSRKGSIDPKLLNQIRMSLSGFSNQYLD